MMGVGGVDYDAADITVVSESHSEFISNKYASKDLMKGWIFKYV